MLESRRPRNRQGYGRRKPATAQLIDSCFTSSSPAKEQNTIEICEDKVVDLLQNLSLDHKEVSNAKQEETTDKPATKDVARRALEPRNPNERRALRLSGGLPEKKKTKKALNVKPTQVEESVVEETVHPHDELQLPSRPRHQENEPVVSNLEPECLANVEKPKTKPSRRTDKPGHHRTRKVPVCEELPIPLAPSTPEILQHAQPLLALCNDQHAKAGPLSFQAWSDSLSTYFQVKKIAEASYGEVFRLSLLPTVKTGFTKADESVLKLIALKAPPAVSKLTAAQKRKQAAMSAVDHVASEVRLLKRMSPVPGFTNFRDVRIVQGRLPTHFVKAWKDYDDNVKRSLFPDPSRKTTYEETQLWAVVEMQDAGTDLETVLEIERPMDAQDEEYEVPQRPEWREISVWAAWDIFWKAACAVAKGEAWAEFEHRDLHLGNICIRANDGKALVEHVAPSTSHPVSVEIRRLGYTSLETTIIDYTLSRANMEVMDSEPVPADRDIAYMDLSIDPALFEGDGDIDYQYDIYRHMRGAVLHADPTIVTEHKHPQPVRKGRGKKGKPTVQDDDLTPIAKDTWREYHPISNLVWLHFILHQLMSVVKLSDDAEGTIAQHALGLYEQLTVLNEEKLALEELKKGDWSSATDMIAWAVETGWLDEEDVVNAGMSS